MVSHAIAAPARSVLESLGAAVARLAHALAENSTAMHCKREADRLSAMSDAELAGLGLTRDRIIAHAFRRYMAN